MAAIMNVQRFPLTRLPASCFRNALRTMSPPQLVVFSLLSKKCKNQAISLNHRSKQMAIHFTHGFIITIKIQQDILRIGFYEPHAPKDIPRKKKLKTPKDVTIAVSRNEIIVEKYKWSTNKIGVKEWVEHLRLIFPNFLKPFFSFSQQSAFQFNLDSVKRMFPSIQKLSILHTGRFNYNQLILKKLLPTEIISISTSCFRDSRIPHRILIQNFASFSYALGPLTRITLNELLINNSKRITSSYSQISSKDFNRFLKLWIKGSNPRMEVLTIVKADDTAIKIVMNGIKHQRMPKTLKRIFIHNQVSILGQGGLDIYRMDGTKATIGLCHREGRLHFLMIVWHDHCIGSL